MKNLIVDAGNYTYVNGKQYGVGNYACNYPILYRDGDLFGLNLTLTNGQKTIDTSDNIYGLLGGSIENNNEPLYKWLISEDGFLVEVEFIANSTSAILTAPFTGGTSLYGMYVLDYFGQPAVKQTYATDSSAGFTVSCVIYTKYGSSTIQVGGAPVPLGSDPVLVNIGGDFAQYALNIQYA